MNESDHQARAYRTARPLARTIIGPVAAILCAVLYTGSAEAKIINWNCAFPVVANPNGVTRDQDFRILFALDDATGKAARIGDNGSIDVIVIAGDRAVTFVERLPSGAIQTTTVDANRHSVHSRHTMTGTGLVPSQSYGTCTTE